MAFDFNYEDSTIQSNGGFKPTKKNVPVDVRTVVDVYADIATIPNPYVGLTVTVKSDETNEGKMTDYKVISLKANGLGVPNMLVDEVKRMNEYLEVSSSGNSSGDLSDYVLKTELSTSLSTKVDKVSGYSLVSDTEIARLANVDNYDDTELMNLIPDKTSDLENDSNFISSNDEIDATTLNGKTISGLMTKEEYEALADKDPNTIYLVDDDEDVGTGMGLTEEQLQQLQKAYEHSQTTHAPVIAEANVQADWNETDTTSDTYIKNKPTSLGGDVILTSPNGTEYKLVVSDEGILSVEGITSSVYGEIISSATSLSISEGNIGTFDVTLNQAPTKDQTINISVDNTDITLSPTSVTFNSSNYNVAQTVSVIVDEDSDYNDETATITLSNSKVSNVLITVSITDNDEESAIESISAIYTQGDTIVYPSTSIDSLKNNLVVTATYTDSSTSTITAYSLSGILVEGTSTITVTYSGKTTTFNVTVSEETSTEMDSAYSYLKVTVPVNATSEQSTLYLSKPTNGIMNSLYINDIPNDIPSGANQQTTSYLLNEGENIIKIKGNFTCWDSKCNINVLQLQNDLTGCANMFYGCSDITFNATIPSTVTNTNGMFKLSGLTNGVDIPSSVTNTGSMYQLDTALITPSTVPDNVIVCDNMYAGCTSLQGTVNVPNSATDITKYLDAAGTNGEGISVIGINISSVTNYSIAFYNAKITTIEQSFADLIMQAKPDTVTDAICFRVIDTYLSSPITINEVHSDWKK